MSGAPLHNSATTPNSQLSSVELAERKRLKRQANQRRKEERVQTKALNRAYKGTDAARAEWKRYGWKEQVELSYTGYAQAMPRRTRLSNSTANCDPIRQAASDSAKQLVEQMVAAYDSSSVKSVEEAHTNELLAHMVKGTQEAGMFTVPSIIGYTSCAHSLLPSSLPRMLTLPSKYQLPDLVCSSAGCSHAHLLGAITLICWVQLRSSAGCNYAQLLGATTLICWVQLRSSAGCHYAHLLGAGILICWVQVYSTEVCRACAGYV